MGEMSAHDIIIRPIITEATMIGVQERKYVFKVHPKANKIQIKEALKKLFGIDVRKVNTMHCKGRRVRYRYSRGFRPDWKKAIVSLEEDSKTIEFYDTLY